MLEIKNISKSYGKSQPALNNLTLTLSPGVFGLLGPNGAGKTTLMKVLATLITIDHGEIIFGKLIYGKEDVAIRKHVGYLPQDFGLYPNLSASEVLQYLTALKGIAPTRELIEHGLQQVNLFEYRHKPLKTLSGGMKQRFGIAQALIGSPKLLIVDEPTAGLDPAERNRFYNLLARLGNDIIVIFSTHIVEDVKEICSKIGIMNRGNLLFQGTAQQVQEQITGTIWEKTVDVSELPNVYSNHQVVLQRFRQGKPFVHVYSKEKPEDGYEPVTPTLEDFFFKILN